MMVRLNDCRPARIAIPSAASATLRQKTRPRFHHIAHALGAQSTLAQAPNKLADWALGIWKSLALRCRRAHARGALLSNKISKGWRPCGARVHCTKKGFAPAAAAAAAAAHRMRIINSLYGRRLIISAVAVRRLPVHS